MKKLHSTGAIFYKCLGVKINLKTKQKKANLLIKKNIKI